MPRRWPERAFASRASSSTIWQPGGAGLAERHPRELKKLKAQYIAAIDALGAKGALVIGGKSMGGRIASMVADAEFERGRIAGLLCLGYPFHPPGKLEQLRTGHLVDLKTPTLIVQGTRDAFGTREEVSTYRLSPLIKLMWLEDGDHDLKPRKRVSGLSAADYIETMAEIALAWAGRLDAPHVTLPAGNRS